MAQKQYSFDFVLNAVLNGGFSGAFAKAQQEFIRLGAEIKNLQALQRDVTSYQKQQAEVQHTTAKLDNLNRQYELVNKQISETTGSTTALEREKLKLEQRIANTTAALEKQQARLDGTTERLNAAGISTDDLAGKDAELAKKIEKLAEEQKKVTEEAGKFGNAGVQAINAVAGAIAAAGIAGALGDIRDAYRECVTIAGDFGQAMSAVEAIAGATSGEMAALTAEAKELGATTIYTAQQSANAMEYMAMAGWDASEMLAGMRGMTTLAAAAGEDLAQVSDIVTDNLSAFGMQASDTAHFADVLAAAAANSNTNISIMGDTFKNSSSVAGALGYSIEDVAVMVGLMANNAVKGSRAGTALRNMFNGLLGGVTLTAEAFGELDYSAVNYDGSMKGLMETVEDLRGYFDQMTEAERVNNAMTIAGMRGYNGLLAILNATDEDFQSLYASINNCSGAAERMAAVKLDNLNGDITLMNSAMEALQTTIGEQFNPKLRELTQFKTELLNGANTFIKEHPALVKGVMAGTAAFAGLGTAIVGTNAAITAFKALNLAALFTGPAGILLGVAGGIAGVTAAVVGFVEATRDGGPAVRELTEAARGLNAAMAEAKASYGDTANSTLAAAEVANTYIGKLEGIEAAEGENAQSNQEYQNVLGLLLRTMPELSNCISQTTDEYGRATYALEGDTQSLRKNTEELRKNAEARAYQGYINTLYDKYGEVMLEAAENSIKLTQARTRLETAQEKLAAACERINEINEIGIGNDQELLQEFWQLQDAVQEYIGEVVTAQQEIDTLNEAIERDGQAVSAAEAEFESAERAVRDLTGAVDDYADEQGNAARIQREAQEALSGTMEKVQALTQAYTEAYDEAAKSFSGQFGLFDEAKADAEATVEAAQRALDSQLSYWRGYAGNIETLRALSAEDLGVTQENYEALMNYVRSGTPEAAGLAASMVEQVNQGNTQALTDLANTLGEISASQDQAAQDVADWTSGLTEQMDQLLLDVAADVAELDMGQEAALAAQNTIQSYIDQAGNMLPQVRNAYRELALAAQLALAPGGAGSGRLWTSAVNPAVNVAWYAEGTENAPPGWAWVGENGPELMRMRGGEQVLPSGASRRVAEEYSAYSRYVGVQESRPPLEIMQTGNARSMGGMELHFHIEAGASPETVSAWQDYANRGALKETILEVMEEADADARRRFMA